LGNHEYYGQKMPDLLQEIKDYTKDDPKFHVLENESIELDGWHFFGCTLWSNFEIFGDPENAMIEAKECMSDYQVCRKTLSFRAGI